LLSSGFISGSAARCDRSQPGRQALRPAACEIIKAEDAQNLWICVPVRPTHSMGNQRAYSAFGARLYTSYLEGSTIAVTGSVCRPVHNQTDTHWLFGNSG
jgi:hypothetical protein